MVTLTAISSIAKPTKDWPIKIKFFLLKLNLLFNEVIPVINTFSNEFISAAHSYSRDNLARAVSWPELIWHVLADFRLEITNANYRRNTWNSKLKINRELELSYNLIVITQWILEISNKLLNWNFEYLNFAVSMTKCWNGDFKFDFLTLSGF